MTSRSDLPDTGFVRLPQILRHIPISRATWWAGVKDGRYPPALKLSANITVWRAEDIHSLIAELSTRKAA
jgi:prophage regulatory protein